MKNFFFVLLFMLFVAGCTKTETNYKQDITGNWVLYKYVLRNADQTILFESHFPGYAIAFSGTGQFIETDTTGYANGGTYHFSSNNQKLSLDDTVHVFIDTVLVDTIFERQYSIFNLTSVSLQLRNDSSELYLEKKP